MWEVEKFQAVRVDPHQMFRVYKLLPAISSHIHQDLQLTRLALFQHQVVLPIRNQHLQQFRLVGEQP